MAKERKIMCDCGGILIERKMKFEEIETEAMVCPKCNFVTLTKEQADKYVKLKQLHKLIDTERKIIRIGNSMGFTLPDGLQEFGAEVGRKVKIKALSQKSFKVELIS